MYDEGGIPFLNHSWCSVAVDLPTFPPASSPVLKLPSGSVGHRHAPGGWSERLWPVSLSSSPWSCCWQPIRIRRAASCTAACLCDMWGVVPLTGLHSPASGALTPSRSSLLQVQELGHASAAGCVCVRLAPVSLCSFPPSPWGLPPHTRPQGAILIPLPQAGPQSSESRPSWDLASSWVLHVLSGVL